MPAKNLEKVYVENGYYHVYSRGINKQKIFLDDQDYRVYLSLFKRYLSHEPTKDNKGRKYPSYSNEIALLAYCLMPNHVHAFVCQSEPRAMTELFRSIMTAYGMYFNKKYNRQGPLFQSRFKASLIQNEAYFQHISRYIHLNPHDYKGYEFSSYQYYLGNKFAEWLQPEKVLDGFVSVDEYARFVDDYTDYKEILHEIKGELANP